MIAVDATPVSSRGYADWDALAVEIRGFDRLGAAVPVRGTLYASLWGQSRKLVASFYNRVVANDHQIRQIASWSQHIDGAGRNLTPASETISSTAVTVTHSCLESVSLVLPLPRPLPDHDLRLAPLGDLHVELVVPGTGTFDAIRADIPLQQTSVLRERLLVETRSRFLPHERTVDSRLPLGPTLETQTTLRPNHRVLAVQP
jgi:hypothetical protein